MAEFKKIDDGLYAMELTEEEKQESIRKVKEYKDEEDSLMKRINNRIF